MNQKKKVKKEKSLVATRSKSESLAQQIIQTAKPVDLAQYRLTCDDLKKISIFVETSLKEQFDDYSEGIIPRSFFDFDAKLFSKQLDGFVIDLAKNRVREKLIKKEAMELAKKWVNFYRYSELRAIWMQSYNEFKQSIR